MEFGLDYLATMVLLQVTLELLNLSDNMNYSRDRFKKGHDRLDKQRTASEFKCVSDNSVGGQATGFSFRSSK